MRIPVTVFGGLLVACLLARTSQAEGLPVYLAVGGSFAQADTTVDTDNRLQPFPPSEISLNGLPFDDDSSGWSIDVGYQITDFLAVEIGYDDLGKFDGKAPVTAGTPLFAPVPGAGFYVPPAFFIGVAPVIPDPLQRTLDVRSFNLAARFGVDLTKRVRATWHLGLARAEFDARGSTVFLLPPETISEPFTELSVPFADPGEETGYLFGFGIGFDLSRQFDAELTYSRQDLRVLEFDTIELRFIGRL